MGLRYLPLEKQVEIEEVVDFNKFKFSIDERCAKKASISITHPYTYFKFNYKNEFVGLLIYNLVDESLDLNNIKSEDLMTENYSSRLELFPGFTLDKNIYDYIKLYFWQRVIFSRYLEDSKFHKFDGWFSVF